MSANFQFLGKIGEGAFATVYKVRRHEDSQIYAFKKMKSIKMADRQLNNCLNEIRILASLTNPYIIGYKEAFYDQEAKSFCLVTEYADGGDLSSKISNAKKSKSNIPQVQIWKVALQLLHGIKALHALKVFHRDIKPANILLTKNDETAKLADMNVSVISKTGLASTQTGTPAYASPEVWMEKPYSGKSDIWSLGCVIYEMAAHKPPFMASDLFGLKKVIISNSYQQIPNCYSTQLQAFIAICLQKDQKNRPSASDLLQMPLLRQKQKQFPNQKFNQAYFPTIQRSNPIMVNTIRLDNGNFKSLQNKLPKCMYSHNVYVDKENKENRDNKDNKENQRNGNRIGENFSCVAKVSGKQQGEKLPQIRRPDSAAKGQDRIMHREVLKKLRG